MRSHFEHRSMRGFSLIGALVAATVLAIGMLGSAAMVVHSLQASRFALQRTKAIILAADIADRIRANRVAASSFVLAADATVAAPPSNCNLIDDCSPAQIAAIELYAWQRSVVLALPGTSTVIEIEPTATPAVHLCTITITWDQTADSPASITLTLQA